MTCLGRSAIVSVIALGLCVIGGDARAQGRAPAGAPERGVDVSMDVFGGWDVDLSEIPTNPVTGEPLARDTSGQYAGVNGSGRVRRQNQSLMFGAGADVSIRRYSDFQDQLVPSYSGNVHVGSLTDRRVRWTATETISYSPVNITPGLYGTSSVAVPTADYQIAPDQQLMFDTSGTLSIGTSRRGSIVIAASYNLFEAPTEDNAWTRRWSADARYVHQTSRYSSVYGGYRYARTDTSTFGDPLLLGSPVIQGINAGVGYARPLSFSRRTLISVQTGVALVEDAMQPRQWTVVGSGGIAHEIGRTWNLSGLYERDLRFVPAFIEPLLTSSFSSQLAGQLSQSASVRITGSVSRGNLGIARDGSVNAVDTYSLSAQFRRAITRRMGFYAEYFFFQSHVGAAVPLPGALNPDSRRNGIRVGLSLGTTLLGGRR